MPDLFLPSLEINNFRGFDHLIIEKLGRVNLITGKNNVGKSALLEAVYLYANNGGPYLLRELLVARDELEPGSDNARRLSLPRNRDIDPACIRYLFHGRTPIDVDTAPLRIGPVSNTEQTVSISLQWFQAIERADEEEQLVRRLIPISTGDLLNNPEARLYVLTQMGGSPATRMLLDNVLQGVNRYGPTLPHIHNKYVKVNGLNINDAASLWDLVALTPMEDEVIKALRIVEPKISRVSIIGEREDIRGAEMRGPVPIIVTEDSPERLPLRSLGEGISRLFGIALSLVNVQNGVLLLDEPDNGLHYSVLRDVWRLVFELAHRLNIQVFATTHSWDSIQAFQEAASADPNEDAMLIRLRYKNNKLAATTFGEQELAIITQDQIEVR